MFTDQCLCRPGQSRPLTNEGEGVWRLARPIFGRESPTMVLHHVFKIVLRCQRQPVINIRHEWHSFSQSFVQFVPFRREFSSIIFKNRILVFINPIEESSEVKACKQTWSVYQSGKDINLSLSSFTVEKMYSNSGNYSTWTETDTRVSCNRLQFNTKELRIACIAVRNPDFLSHPPDAENVAKSTCDQMEACAVRPAALRPGISSL